MNLLLRAAAHAGRRERSDPRRAKARTALAGIGVGRIGLGVTALVAPNVMRLMFPDVPGDAQSTVVVRMLAGRDLALGVATLVAQGSDGALCGVAVAAMISDLNDALLSLGAARLVSPGRWLPSVVAGFASAAVGGACVAVLRAGDREGRR